MRYRLELNDEDLVVRNVETDLELGAVLRQCIDDPHDPNRLILTACTVFNSGGQHIATICTSNPLEAAAVAVANYEAHYGYPGFKPGAERPEPYRIERRLGTLLADTASVIGRGLFEFRDGGVKAETKEKFGELIAQLYDIWYASRFGSFDAERGVQDPYFANTPSCHPRMSFAAAARHYGMDELRFRFPDASEAALKKALSWPLEMLERTLNSLVPS